MEVENLKNKIKSMKSTEQEYLPDRENSINYLKME